MAKPIIGGPDTNKSQAPRASSGGVTRAKSLPYSPPKGPTNQMRQGVGLGGTNYGPCGSQGEYSLKTQTSGSPGIGGTNHGNKGSQDDPQY